MVGFFNIFFNGLEFVVLGPEVREPNKETKNSRLFKKIVEYLKTDSYMYAPLVAAPQSISPPTGPSISVIIIIFIVLLLEIKLQICVSYCKFSAPP